MTIIDFIDAVAIAVPRARDSLRKILADDLAAYATTVAAGELGEYAIALYEQSEAGSHPELTAILALTEAAAASSDANITGALASDYFPAIASLGPIPHRLFEMMGPATKQMMLSGGDLA